MIELLGLPNLRGLPCFSRCLALISAYHFTWWICQSFQVLVGLAMLERVVLLRPAAESSTELAELQVLGRCLFVSDENNASASTSRVTEK